MKQRLVKLTSEVSELRAYPALIFFLCSFVFLFFLFLFWFSFWKDQVRWPKGPPHLALNPHCFWGICFFWFVRDFVKALETTTARKRHKISCTFCSDSGVSNLSLHGPCMSRSLQYSAKVFISGLLARNCCSLAVVVSEMFASRRWPGGEVVISRSLLLGTSVG